MLVGFLVYLKIGGFKVVVSVEVFGFWNVGLFICVLEGVE